MSAFSGKENARMLIVVLGFTFVYLFAVCSLQSWVLFGLCRVNAFAVCSWDSLKSIVAPIATTTTTAEKLTGGMHTPNP